MGLIDRGLAAALGREAVEIIEGGEYQSANGHRVNIRALIVRSVDAKVSIPPDADLPTRVVDSRGETRYEVANTTTLAAARELVAAGRRVVALNFANGVVPGGGFLSGSRAQEEGLCWSSALYATLAGDPMYDAHRARGDTESSEWAILSPDVPVFRGEDRQLLDEPWLCSFLTCAAPYAPAVGLARAQMLMAARIPRVLEIAASHGYDALVLGAWGCGAFGNDPVATAESFHEALLGEYDGAFGDVVFAIVDWSPDGRTIGPFRDRFRG